MINQQLQANIGELQEFIDSRPDAREVRKALFCKAGLSRLQI
jgi:putative transposase